MSPIITHDDEIELAKMERELASKMRKTAKAQTVVINSQIKFAENVTKMNILRESLNRTFRDVIKQMQMLARERRSNVKDEEVNFYQDIIHKNDDYVEGNNKYINALKDLAVRKEYLVNMKNEIADSLSEVADKRTAVIKKALNVEKMKNKMIEGDKLNLLDAQLNDSQRDFDRARDIFLKKINQFLQAKKEVDDLWIKLKDSTSALS